LTYNFKNQYTVLLPQVVTIYRLNKNIGENYERLTTDQMPCADNVKLWSLYSGWHWLTDLSVMFIAIADSKHLLNMLLRQLNHHPTECRHTLKAITINRQRFSSYNIHPVNSSNWFHRFYFL